MLADIGGKEGPVYDWSGQSEHRCGGHQLRSPDPRCALEMRDGVLIEYPWGTAQGRFVRGGLVLRGRVSRAWTS